MYSTDVSKHEPALGSSPLVGRSGSGVYVEPRRLPGSPDLTPAALCAAFRRCGGVLRTDTQTLVFKYTSRSSSVRPGPPRFGHSSWVLTPAQAVAASHLHGRYRVRRGPEDDCNEEIAKGVSA